MLYSYYVKSTSGRSMKCPAEHTDQYFQTLLDLGAVSPAVAKGLLHAGVTIHLKHCQFYAIPMRQIDRGITEPMRMVQ
jgi:hypothetical protein